VSVTVEDPATWLRLSLFVAILLVLLAFERVLPLRTAPPVPGRLATNLGFGALSAVLVGLLTPLGAAAAAHWAMQNSFGLLHWLGVTGMLAGLLGLVLLDCAIYWQHRIMHMVPLLWRLHLTHHTDPAIDVTSGVRFHPGEAVFSMLFQAGVAVLLGVRADVVLLFAIVLNAASLFEHSNIALHYKVERRLRWLIVTPAMHIVHHSRADGDTNTNFGFCLSLWDRVFGSYRPRSEAALDPPGLSAYDSASEQRFTRLLGLPFRERV
jgi:sterol desaturase/sphingolipid hydroxylase (fatty acid hydroxylase superfamily)